MTTQTQENNELETLSVSEKLRRYFHSRHPKQASYKEAQRLYNLTNSGQYYQIRKKFPEHCPENNKPRKVKKKRKRSGEVPAEGTKARILFDYFLENPDAEISKVTAQLTQQLGQKFPDSTGCEQRAAARRYLEEQAKIREAAPSEPAPADEPCAPKACPPQSSAPETTTEIVDERLVLDAVVENSCKGVASTVFAIPGHGDIFVRLELGRVSVQFRKLHK